MKKDLRYEKLKENFSNKGFVLSKNFSRGYAVARDIGGGWTDSNDLIMMFGSLNGAEKWLTDKIKRDSMTEEEKLQQANKEMKWY